jgi:hypothetical protein
MVASTTQARFSVVRAGFGFDMHFGVNQETVNDSAKLIMHRLISRAIAGDPSLIEAAKASHARIAQRYAGHAFVPEWDDLLKLSPMELRARLISREPDMVRLRASSPFLLGAGVDFTDYDYRLRIRRAARRVVERARKSASRPSAAVG